MTEIKIEAREELDTYKTKKKVELKFKTNENRIAIEEIEKN